MAEKEYIEREAAILEFETNGSGFVYGRRTCAAIISRLKLVPDADVRPVVRGRWELSDEKPYIRKHYHPVACSNCHCAGMEKWNYCPNCGASMVNENE